MSEETWEDFDPADLVLSAGPESVVVADVDLSEMPPRRPFVGFTS